MLIILFHIPHSQFPLPNSVICLLFFLSEFRIPNSEFLLLCPLFFLSAFRIPHSEFLLLCPLLLTERAVGIGTLLTILAKPPVSQKGQLRLTDFFAGQNPGQ